LLATAVPAGAARKCRVGPREPTWPWRRLAHSWQEDRQSAPNGHAVCTVETMEVTIMNTSTQSPSERAREIIRHLEEVEANLAQLARSLHQTRKHFQHALPELENWWAPEGFAQEKPAPRQP